MKIVNTLTSGIEHRLTCCKWRFEVFGYSSITCTVSIFSSFLIFDPPLPSLRSTLPVFLYTQVKKYTFSFLVNVKMHEISWKSSKALRVA
jgi:hypothetical protein